MTALEVWARGDTRATDAERDRCAIALRHHYAAGCLEAHELEERLDRANRARTRRELRTLVADLPRERRSGGPLSRAAVRTHALAFTAVNGGLTGVWAATGEGFYWPGGVLAPWAVLLAGHVLTRRVAKRAHGAVRRRLLS